MSFMKHLHTDGSENWFLHLFAYLFSIPCLSYIDSWRKAPLHCSMVRWHSGRHYDRLEEMGWCYGDDLFDDIRKTEGKPAFK